MAVIYDLYSGQGGAGMGYHKAGFGTVVGVDIESQPRYPFGFVKADSLEVLARLAAGRAPWPGAPEPDAIHASPVCKDRSVATPVEMRHGQVHPRQIGPTRDLLDKIGKPWVIENVPPTPGSEYLRPDYLLCGCVVGLDELERERWFETGHWLPPYELRPPCHHVKPIVTVTGHGRNRNSRGTGLKSDWARAMDIGWMTRNGLAQAVPWRYTELIGRHLLAYLEG